MCNDPEAAATVGRRDRKPFSFEQKTLQGAATLLFIKSSTRFNLDHVVRQQLVGGVLQRRLGLGLVEPDSRCSNTCLTALATPSTPSELARFDGLALR